MKRKPLFRSESLVMARPLFGENADTAENAGIIAELNDNFSFGKENATLRCTELQIQIKYVRAAIEQEIERVQDVTAQISHASREGKRVREAYAAKTNKMKEVLSKLQGDLLLLESNIERLKMAGITSDVCDTNDMNESLFNKQLISQANELSSRTKHNKEQEKINAIFHQSRLDSIRKCLESETLALKREEERLERELRDVISTGRLLKSECNMYLEERCAGEISIRSQSKSVGTLTHRCTQAELALQNTLQTIVDVQERVQRIIY